MAWNRGTGWLGVAVLPSGVVVEGSMVSQAVMPYGTNSYRNLSTGTEHLRLQVGTDDSLNLVPGAGRTKSVLRVFGQGDLVAGGNYQRVDLRADDVGGMFLLTEANGLTVLDLGLGREGPDGNFTTDWWIGGSGADAGHFWPGNVATTNSRDIGRSTRRVRTAYVGTSLDHLVGTGTNTQVMVGRLAGNLAPSVTGVGTVGTGEDNLMNTTLEANSLSAAGKTVRLVAFGTLGANGESKRIRAYFGSTTLIDSGAITPNGVDWMLDIHLIASGAANQKAVSRLSIGSIATGSTVDYTAPAETASGAITMRITGESTDASVNDNVRIEGRYAWFGN